MEGRQGARPAIAGPVVQSKSCQKLQRQAGPVSSRHDSIRALFKEQPVFVKAKCHLRRSSFIFLKLDHMRRYSAWLINVAALHNRISISSKFGGFRVRPCRWNSKSRLKMSKTQSSDPGSLKRFFLWKPLEMFHVLFILLCIFDPTHYCLYFLCADVLRRYSPFIFLILFIFSCRTLCDIKTALEINVLL